MKTSAAAIQNPIYVRVTGLALGAAPGAAGNSEERVGGRVTRCRSVQWFESRRGFAAVREHKALTPGYASQ